MAIELFRINLLFHVNKFRNLFVVLCLIFFIKNVSLIPKENCVQLIPIRIIEKGDEIFRAVQENCH